MSEKLKFIRKAEGLSQSEFADMVGISRRSLISWENEGRIMGVDKLEQITSHERFKKYAVLLATRDDQDGNEFIFKNPSREEVTRALEELPEEKADQVLEYIRFINAQNEKNNQRM